MNKAMKSVFVFLAVCLVIVLIAGNAATIAAAAVIVGKYTATAAVCVAGLVSPLKLLPWLAALA